MARPHNDYSSRILIYEPPRTFVKSAIRALNVLEYFYRYRQPARLAEIGRELDLPASSTKYLLTSLVESGYLNFDDKTKRYFPSILVTGFASWLSRLYPNGEALRELALEAHAELGEIVSIMVMHEECMRAFIIEWDEVKQPLVFDYQLRIPLLESASGNVALAMLNERDVDQIVLRECQKLPPSSREEQRARIFERLQNIRNGGYTSMEHHPPGAGPQESGIAYAVPIYCCGGSPPMVLDIFGPKERLQKREKEIIKTMKELIGNYESALSGHAETLSPRQP